MITLLTNSDLLFRLRGQVPLALLPVTPSAGLSQCLLDPHLPVPPLLTLLRTP